MKEVKAGGIIMPLRVKTSIPSIVNGLIAGRQRLYPWIVGCIFLAAWQLGWLHQLLGLKVYQLPIPADIVQSLVDEWDVLFLYSQYTGVEIIGGFLLGSAIGFLLAIPASLFPDAGRGGIAMVATLNAIPIVALAPVMNNWLGEGVSSRIGVITILTMATMCVNTFKGMTSVNSTYFELMQSYAASKWQIFLKIRLPHSWPYVFAAMKINMTTSIIGAIVGEFFFASRGLGYLLSDQIKLANMPLAWACITLAAILGIVFYYIVQSTERWFMPWKFNHGKR